MIQFNRENNTIANVYCDACGEQITEIATAAVLFLDEKHPAKHWFVHKGKCFNQIEKKYSGERRFLPWWEMEWFFRDILISFDDLKTSGQKAVTGFCEKFTVQRKANYEHKNIKFGLA